MSPSWGQEDVSIQMGEDTVNMKKRIIGGILCLALLLSLTAPVCVKAADQTISEGAFDFRITSAGAEVTAFRATDSSEVAVPSQVQGCPVVAIGDQVFRNLEGITKITLPEGLTTIGDRAFYACTDLAQVTLPDALKEIGDMAFSNCYALKALQLPVNVESIGISAFLNCTALTSLQVVEGNSSFKAVENVLFSADMTVLVAYLNTMPHKTYTVPSQVQTIAEKAFLECGALETVVLPEALEEIGKYAFSGCTALSEVTIPDRVEKIGSFAFNNCTGLTKAVLGEGVTKVPSYAFSGCESLTDVTLGAQVKSIDMQAFAECDELDIIILPETLTQVGRNGLGSPEIIFFRGTKAQKEAITFYSADVSTLEEAAWHYGVEEAVFAQQNCYYCTECDNYFLPDGSYALATVTFLHADGSVLSTAQYRYRDTVEEPEQPTMEGPYRFVGWDKEVIPCAGDAVYTAVFELKYILGDTNGDEAVDNQDVVYLLWHVLFGDEYPLKSEADFVKNDSVDNADVIYLLWHLLFGAEEYPLS